MPKEFVKFLFLFLVAFLFDNYAIENSGEYVGKWKQIYFTHLRIMYCSFRIFSISSFSITDFLLCRGCGHEIVDPSHITHIPSKVAHRQRNDTISGQNGTLIQLFKNPDGIWSSHYVYIYTLDLISVETYVQLYETYVQLRLILRLKFSRLAP